jgi:Ca2+-transporting ATPase
VSFASNALRVLGIASKPDAVLESAQTGMTFLGLTGMIDPPRPEAKEAIAICETAGIRACDDHRRSSAHRASCGA